YTTYVLYTLAVNAYLSIFVIVVHIGVRNYQLTILVCSEVFLTIHEYCFPSKDIYLFEKYKEIILDELYFLYLCVRTANNIFYNIRH
ncbi:hypothetical protein ACJX0J_012310, partial [Zea mays]